VKKKNSTISATLVNKLPPLRPKDAAALVPCSIGPIYEWMDQGRFKHWSVKMPGKNRGMRFIDRASFEAFLASIREGVEA
jgi:hypothetical protein